jgi:hypothetical protein
MLEQRVRVAEVTLEWHHLSNRGSPDGIVDPPDSFCTGFCPKRDGELSRIFASGESRSRVCSTSSYAGLAAAYNVSRVPRPWTWLCRSGIGQAVAHVTGSCCRRGLGNVELNRRIDRRRRHSD